MRIYLLATLFIGLACLDARGAEAPLPKKFHGDWAFSPGDCQGKILENDTGVRIDGASVLAFDDACYVVKVLEDKGYALKATFRCDQGKLSAQRTMTLKLGADTSRLLLGERQLFRCDAPGK